MGRGWARGWERLSSNAECRYKTKSIDLTCTVRTRARITRGGRRAAPRARRAAQSDVSVYTRVHATTRNLTKELSRELSDTYHCTRRERVPIRRTGQVQAATQELTTTTRWTTRVREAYSRHTPAHSCVQSCVQCVCNVYSCLISEHAGRCEQSMRRVTSRVVCDSDGVGSLRESVRTYGKHTAQAPEITDM